MELNAKKGDVTLFLAERGLTPLFRVSAFRRSWIECLLGKPKTIYFGGPTVKGLPPHEEVLEQITPDLS